MITWTQLTTNGFAFTVAVPAKAIDDAVRRGESVADWHRSYNYRTVVKSFENTGRTCTFIETEVDSRWLYVGTLEASGLLRATNGTRIDTSKPRFRLAVRIVQAIRDGRGDAIIAAGYSVEPVGEAKTEAAPERPADFRGPLAFIADTFTVAVGYGLERPMLRVHFRDRRFKFYLSKRGTVCLKTGALSGASENGHRDPVGTEEYAGCLVRGEFLPAKEVRGDQYPPRIARNRELLPVEKEFLDRLAADATGFIAECGRDMSRCCYCNLPLEDARSKAVGYGETCAKRWGLPWGDEKARENAPSFAKSYDDDARAMLHCIREQAKSGEETGWLVFADWLQEKGLPRCTAPKRGTLLPRND